ncbi:MAG: hypothetical protein V1900_03680 [Candidatus Aenigmatarchaeota archaeon]
MKISIVNERNNPIMKRNELVVEIEHASESTPAKAALQIFLSKELKKEVEHIDVKNIFSSHGKAKSKSSVFVWETKRAKDLSKVVKEETKEAEVEKKEDTPKTKEDIKE